MEEAKNGGKSAIWLILCCRLSITVVSTPPSSMPRINDQRNVFYFCCVRILDRIQGFSTKLVLRNLKNKQTQCEF